MVAVEKVTAPVPTVAARARHDVNGAASLNWTRQIDIQFRKLEFLHHLLGEVHALAAAGYVDIVGDVAAIHGDRGPEAAAQNADIEQGIELADCSRGDLHARFER